jgi:hypothetical protein
MGNMISPKVNSVICLKLVKSLEVRCKGLLLLTFGKVLQQEVKSEVFIRRKEEMKMRKDLLTSVALI